ncbi:MAG: restriction endonuclease PLD domain-containing protein [Microcoleaceae cyanobacterium]
MAIYTNYPDFGGSFGDRLNTLLKKATSVTIASGYTSGITLQQYEEDITRIVNNGGNFTLLVGMGIFEGLNRHTYNKLAELNSFLLSANTECGGVRFVWNPPPFHGKIYKIKYQNEFLYFAGSSNFSKRGLFDNLEFTCKITDIATINQTEAYINWLLTDNISVNIAKCESFPIIESVKASRKKINFQKAETQPIINSTVPYLDISLARVEQQQKSNLNTFFGKGRWNRKTGIVIPRDWFEVEIIVDIATTKNPIYPKGDFVAYTDDGLVFPCRTQGDYHKNLRSKDDLKVLGHWIKGKLKKQGVLELFKSVTSQTLE